MGKAWIESLATEIKEKGRDAAESYDRDQHLGGIIAAEGKVFFLQLVLCLDQDLGEIRSQLQGSAVSCDTSVVKDGPTQIRLIRNRFPWFDATLKHEDAKLVLDYVQGRGAAGDKALLSSANRQADYFAFQVDAQDKLWVAESFGDDPQRFDSPEALSKHIVEILFKM